MRFITYQSESGPALGLLTGERAGPLPGMDMLGLIRQGQAGLALAGEVATTALPLSSLALLAPLPNPPRNIICLGISSPPAHHLAWAMPAPRPSSCSPAMWWSARWRVSVACATR